MHRFGLDGMLQGYGVNWKHLQNRSHLSLHGKQHKLTKSQRVVLHFYYDSLGQHKKCRSPSYRLWLWITCGFRTAVGRFPGYGSWELWPIFGNSCSSSSSPGFGLNLCCHPSGLYEDCLQSAKALPVPDSTLQLCGSGRFVSGAHETFGDSCCSQQMRCTEKPKLA